MARNERVENKQPHPSTLLSLLSGWVQQGVDSFFATQRLLVDVARRQNAAAIKGLREGLTDPEHSPMALVTELMVEGSSSFLEAQRILLNLAQQENELVMGGIKERVEGFAPAAAMTDLVRRTVGTFVEMQQDFLKTTSKQTMSWLDAMKHGKPYEGTHLIDTAREGMDHFVKAQKKFLDIVSEEIGKAANGKPRVMTKAKKTELNKVARQATDAFIEAQKRLLDVLGQQMTVNLDTASKTMEMMSPGRLLPMATFTGEGVRSFVEAEKNLLDSIAKPRTESKKKTTRGAKRTGAARAMASTA